jgi:hypothetical protein
MQIVRPVTLLEKRIITKNIDIKYQPVKSAYNATYLYWTIPLIPREFRIKTKKGKAILVAGRGSP